MPRFTLQRVRGALAILALALFTLSASAQTVVATGRDLFLAKGCAVCHDGPDTESQFDAAPDLGELPRVAATRQAGLGAADYVRRSITSPDSFTVPGFGSEGMGSMPALALAETKQPAEEEENLLADR